MTRAYPQLERLHGESHLELRGRPHKANAERMVHHVIEDLVGRLLAYFLQFRDAWVTLTGTGEVR
jgi:hypothetical protein